MSNEGISRAVSALGVEVVDLLGAVLGGRWAAAVIPFTRVRMGTSEVDVVLPSALDLEGADQSAALREVTSHGTELRLRLALMATQISSQLDASGVVWDWGAVRVRRTQEGGTRAGLELGTGLPPMRPLDLLGPGTIPPPPADAVTRTSSFPAAVTDTGRFPSVFPASPARPSFLPPAPAAPQIPVGPGGRVRTLSLPFPDPAAFSIGPDEAVEEEDFASAPASEIFPNEPILPPESVKEVRIGNPLGQPELAKTMNRAQQINGPKQAQFAQLIVRHHAALVPRDRSVEFSVQGQPPLRFPCDQIALYTPAEVRWDWGWGVESWSPALRAQSEKLRATGGNWSLLALSTPRLNVPPDPAARLALMSAWILGASAYHFVRTDGGQGIVLAVYAKL